MKLRLYQSKALDAIGEAATGGCNRQLVVLPTGGGKTQIFSFIPERLRLRRPDKMLVLVQAEELAFQAVDKLQKCNPTLRVGLEKAQYKSAWNDDIVVASVQSLAGSKLQEDGSWLWSKRLLTMDPEAFRYVIIDEAHHATAPTYAGPLRYFKVCKGEPAYNDPTRFLLGVTATPNRSDNKGLEAFFQTIVFSRDILSMINAGWLAKVEAHRVDTMVSLDDVDFRGGQWVKDQLEKTVNIPARNKLIVEKYLELGEGAPFLGFTVDIQHTADLTEAFRAQGVACYGIASKSGHQSEWLITGEKDRAQCIEKYNNGEFQGLVSCQALLEGFDAPRATVGLGAAPTASTLRFTQGIGRILRPFPAPEEAVAWTGWKKRCAIWIDFVDNCSKHSLITAPTLFGLRADFNAKGKSLTDTVEEIERIQKSKPGVNASLYTDLAGIKAASARIDLFAAPQVPREIARLSQFAWMTGLAEGTWTLPLPDRDKTVLSVKLNAIGEYEIARHVNGVRTPVGVARTFAEALKLADRGVPQEATVLLRSDANWRRLPPTEPQMLKMKYLYPDLRRKFTSDDEFFQMVGKTYSRGDLAGMLSAREGRDRYEKRWGKFE